MTHRGIKTQDGDSILTVGWRNVTLTAHSHLPQCVLTLRRGGETVEARLRRTPAARVEDNASVFDGLEAVEALVKSGIGGEEVMRAVRRVARAVTESEMRRIEAEGAVATTLSLLAEQVVIAPLVSRVVKNGGQSVGCRMFAYDLRLDTRQLTRRCVEQVGRAVDDCVRGVAMSAFGRETTGSVVEKKEAGAVAEAQDQKITRMQEAIAMLESELEVFEIPKNKFLIRGCCSVIRSAAMPLKEPMNLKPRVTRNATSVCKSLKCLSCNRFEWITPRLCRVSWVLRRMQTLSWKAELSAWSWR